MREKPRDSRRGGKAKGRASGPPLGGSRTRRGAPRRIKGAREGAKKPALRAAGSSLQEARKAGESERERRVAEEIVRIARDELELDAGRLGERGTPLAGQLDSLALLSLVVAVEDRFRIVLGDDDAAETRTLLDLSRLVLSRAKEEHLP